MRRGEQSMPTIRRVEAEVEKINSSGILPPGVRIEKIYDRSELINVTTQHRAAQHDLRHRADLPRAVAVPRQSCAAPSSSPRPFPSRCSSPISIMVLRGEFGQSAVGRRDRFRPDRRCDRDHGREHLPASLERREVATRSASAGSPRRPGAGFAGKLRDDPGSAAEVNQAIFFSAAIIIAGFVPLFTLSGIEGHIFGPMAKTYAYAIAGGLIATFTVSPALSALLLPEHMERTETFVVRGLRRVYRPVVGFALANRIVTLGGAGVLVGLGAARGALARASNSCRSWRRAISGSARPCRPRSRSRRANGYVNRMRADHQELPEVETVVSQHGRPDDGTDATGFFNAEFFVPLKAVRHLARRRRQGEADGGQSTRRWRRSFPASISISRNTSRTMSRRRPRGSRARTRSSCSATTSRRSRRRPAKIKAGDRRRCRGSPIWRCFEIAGPADRPDRHRPGARRPLRAGARRHQRDDRGGDRRPGGRQPL